MRVSHLFAAPAEAKCKQILEPLMSHPKTATTAGWVFEGLVHRILSSGGVFRCGSLTTNDDLLAELVNCGTQSPTFAN